MDDLENRSCHNNLRFVGFPEKSEEQFLLTWVRGTLGHNVIIDHIRSAVYDTFFIERISLDVPPFICITTPYLYVMFASQVLFTFFSCLGYGLPMIGMEEQGGWVGLLLCYCFFPVFLLFLSFFNCLCLHWISFTLYALLCWLRIVGCPMWCPAVTNICIAYQLWLTI